MTDSAPIAPSTPATATAVPAPATTAVSASVVTESAPPAPSAPPSAPTYADGHGDALTSVLELVLALDRKVQATDLRLDDIRKLRADIALLAVPAMPEPAEHA